MGATPYKAVTWSAHEVITKPKLDQMNTNLQWVNDNTPRVRYTNALGVQDDNNITIVSGRAYITRNKYSYGGGATVYFGNAFKPGTAPHITTGIVSDQKYQTFCVVNGLGSLPAPDYRGFELYINVTQLSARPRTVNGKLQRDVPDRPIYIHWHAYGETIGS